jgi:hypothetical protein
MTFGWDHGKRIDPLKYELKRDTDGLRKESRRVGVKKRGRRDKHFISGGRKKILFRRFPGKVRPSVW